MTRTTLLALIALGGTVTFHRVSAQSPAEKPVIDVVNAAYEAAAAADFNRLTLLVHPRTQQLFRDLLSARADVLLRTYPQDQISYVSGLPAHPRDLSLSDPEFFAFTCYMTKLRHPEFGIDSKYFPLTLEGTTFDRDQLAHVVLSWPVSVRTERTNFTFVESTHLFLRQEQSHWLVWSCPFARAIGESWSRDLAKLNHPEVAHR